MRIFVTGASGWIGSAVVPELLKAGHEVVGLARSEASAQRLVAAGATVQRGDLDDPDGLRDATTSADGVIHLAFRHDLLYAGDMAGAAVVDRQAIEVLGEALAGSNRPLVIASGVFGIAPGRKVTEQDGIEAAEGTDGPIDGASDRMANAHYTASLAAHGVRSCVLRLPPTCHGDGDNGFMAILVGVARDRGVSGYVGDGSARWPATHRLDVARAFRFAVGEGTGRLDPPCGSRGGRNRPRLRRGHWAQAQHPGRIGLPRQRTGPLRVPGLPVARGQPRLERPHPRGARMGANRAEPARRPRPGPLLPSSLSSGREPLWARRRSLRPGGCLCRASGRPGIADDLTMTAA